MSNNQRNEILKKFLQDHNIKVKNFNLYSIALTHSSYSNEHPNVQNNEKYEFLGDRILNFIAANFVFNNTKGNKLNKFQHKYESIVNNNHLIKVAKKLKFNELILLSSDKKNIGDEYLADCLEAFIAAIYLDNKNLALADEFIKKHIINHLIKK